MDTSIGRQAVQRLRRFTEALQNGEPITERFTCRKIILDLKPQAYDPELVKETRKLLNLSQALFAKFLGVSRKTVQAWEQGVMEPRDMACRFMDEIRLDPEYWRRRVSDAIRKTEAIAT